MKKKLRFYLAVILFISFVFILQGTKFPNFEVQTLAEPHSPKQAPQNQKAIQKLKETDEYDSLEKAIIAAWYKVEASDANQFAFQAENKANQFRANFDKQGLKVFLDKNGQKLESVWKLKSIGRGEIQKAVLSDEIKADKNRFEIQHKSEFDTSKINLTEWFENKPEGLEQGFTIFRKPLNQKNKNLRLVLSVEGDFLLKTDADRQGLTLLTKSGNEILRYEKLKVWDASGKNLSAQINSRSNNVFIEVNDKTAVYPLTIDPTFKQVKALAASDGDDFDRFGNSISIDGYTAVIGAYGDSIGSNSGQGSAYIFKRSGKTWYQEAKITASDGAANDRFGSNVSISGGTVVIGAPFDDISNKTDQGSAYVFVRNGNYWSQQWKLTASDGAASDKFGISVDIDNDSVVVGANGDDIGLNSNQGSVYAFVRNGSLWSQQAKLTLANGKTNDKFGHTVAISGDTTVLGANYYDQINDLSNGSAYIFTRNASIWTEHQKLAPNDNQNGPIGWDVDMYGDTAVVSAFTPSFSIPSSKPRAVYVFVKDGTNWTEQAKLIDTQPDSGFREFGKSVAIDKNTVAVGAPSFHDHPQGLSWLGEVHVFFRSVYNNVWFNQQILTASSESDPYNFGHEHALGTSVAVSGNYLIAGDPDESLFDNTKQGSAYIFATPTRAQSRSPLYYELPFYYPKFRIILDTDWAPDLALYRNGTWLLRKTEEGVSETEFGLPSDIPVPADYDGDGITDIAVFRDGVWFINQSREGFRELRHGQHGDVPVSGFFDSDVLADFAVFRNGTWYLLQSREGTKTVRLGVGTDQPFAADFDGDELYDLAVFRDGTWYWLSSESGEQREVRLGQRGDIPVIEDFDGDFLADLGVFNQGIWQIQQSTEGYKTFKFGESGDLPMPSDYDVDGRADVAVFRDGLWLIKQSSAGMAEVEFGQRSYVPLSGTTQIWCAGMTALGPFPSSIFYRKRMANVVCQSSLNSRANGE